MRVNIEEKSYDGKRKILKNIKLDIPKHQTTLIIGTSGAGKSTLIKCLIHQTKFKGTIIDEEYDHKVMLEKIAYIPQHPALNKNETEKCINDVGLNYVCKQPVKSLSGGQMQRVAIAKELIRDKEILIADEIDTGLDCGVARSLCNMLNQIAHKEKKTVIVISHNLINIEIYDNVVILVKDSNKTGRIAYHGSPYQMKTFFQVDDYVDILMKLNSEDEGGENLADFYIDQYERSI